MKLCITVGLTIGSYLGWELGDRYGMMMAFALSSVGSVLGVVGGWWIARRLLE